MGQDRKNRQGGDADLTATRSKQQPRVFQQEIRAALRYERGLFIKALLALAVVAMVVILRTLYFA